MNNRIKKATMARNCLNLSTFLRKKRMTLIVNRRQCRQGTSLPSRSKEALQF